MSSFFIIALSFNSLLFLVLKFNLADFISGLQGKVFLNALMFTLEQALLSAALSVLIGLVAAPGFARLTWFKRPARWFLLLPNMMSPVLVVLCLLITFKNFPYGLWGIIIGHVFLNSGLATVWLGEKWHDLETSYGAVAIVTGARDPYFFKRGVLPLMLPQIKNTFAVIFSLCLTSFAIPLVLGGGPQASTLEVLIFERIHTEADVSSAMAIGIFQCLLQFGVFWLVLRPLLLKTEYRRPWQSANTGKSVWPWLTLVVAGISILPPLEMLLLALPQASKLKEIWGRPEFQAAMQNSLFVALVIGALIFLILAFLTSWGWWKSLPKLPALSSVVVGLSGIILFQTSVFESQSRLVLILIWGQMAVIFLPVFRLTYSRLENIRNRFEKVVIQLGAPRRLSFKKIYGSLGLRIYIAGGILGICWSMGEFSVARMMAPAQSTLPLYVQSLLSNYRLEEAALTASILFVLSICSMAVFEVIADGVG